MAADISQCCRNGVVSIKTKKWECDKVIMDTAYSLIQDLYFFPQIYGQSAGVLFASLCVRQCLVQEVFEVVLMTQVSPLFACIYTMIRCRLRRFQVLNCFCFLCLQLIINSSFVPERREKKFLLQAQLKEAKLNKILKEFVLSFYLNDYN